MAYCSEELGAEDAVFHGKGKDALHVVGRLLVEAGGEVFVEEFVGAYVVASSA